MTIIRIIGSAWGEPTPLDGTWLKSYDPEANGGRGEVIGTKKEHEAMRFADFEAAMACWRQVSHTLPTRPDGKPNRPLTAFHIEFSHDTQGNKR